MSSRKSSLDAYIAAFSGLNRDSNKPDLYPATTLHSAPHKPLLLLAVLDRFAERQVDANRIPLTPALVDLFVGYWRKAMPVNRHPDVAMPFYHLTGDGFWHLIPKAGHESVVEHKRLRSIKLLHEHTKGARLDDELYRLLQDAEARAVLRRTLIETYFNESIQPLLQEQGQINEDAYRYSRALLDHARKRSDSVDSVSEPVAAPVRDQGFRRAVVEAYKHRCAISGMRILTVDRLTAVDAAHILPWAEFHNDDPRNGLALTKLCHWVYEQGLLTVTPDYRVRISHELTAEYNRTYAVANLERVGSARKARMASRMMAALASKWLMPVRRRCTSRRRYARTESSR